MSLIDKKKAQGRANEYRLWCAAESLGWDCTIAQAARAAGISASVAQKVVVRKGWHERFNLRFVPERDEVQDVCSMIGGDYG